MHILCGNVGTQLLDEHAHTSCVPVQSSNMKRSRTVHILCGNVGTQLLYDRTHTVFMPVFGGLVNKLCVQDNGRSRDYVCHASIAIKRRFVRTHPLRVVGAKISKLICVQNQQPLHWCACTTTHVERKKTKLAWSGRARLGGGHWLGPRQSLGP